MDRKRHPELDSGSTSGMTEKKIPCEIYSRVVGYYRPVNNWNVGKKQEYSERNVYDGSVNSHPELVTRRTR